MGVQVVSSFVSSNNATIEMFVYVSVFAFLVLLYLFISAFSCKIITEA